VVAATRAPGRTGTERARACLSSPSARSADACQGFPINAVGKQGEVPESEMRKKFCRAGRPGARRRAPCTEPCRQVVKQAAEAMCATQRGGGHESCPPVVAPRPPRGHATKAPLFRGPSPRRQSPAWIAATPSCRNKPRGAGATASRLTFCTNGRAAVRPTRPGAQRDRLPLALTCRRHHGPGGTLPHRKSNLPSAVGAGYLAPTQGQFVPVAIKEISAEDPSEFNIRSNSRREATSFARSKTTDSARVFDVIRTATRYLCLESSRARTSLNHGGANNKARLSILEGD